MLTIRKLAHKFALPLWPWYLCGCLFLAATNRITVEIPQLIKEIVNKIGAQPPDALSSVAIAIIALGCLQFLSRSISRISIFWPGRALEATSKTWLFSKTMKLPQKFFLEYGMGDLISRLSNDLGQIRVFFAFGILQLLNMLFILWFTVSKMLEVHSNLTWIALIPIAAMLIVTRFIMPKMQKYARQSQEAVGKLTNKVTEAFVNVHVIQSHAAENAFIKKAEAENYKVFVANMKNVIIRTLFFPLMTTLTGISQLIVLYYGGSQVMDGNLTVGDIVAFNIYLTYMAFPLTSLGIILSIYQRTKTAVERISPIYEEDEEYEEQEKPPIQPGNDAPLLEIKNLSYSYPKSSDHPNPKEVLSDISFTINHSKKIGLFGSVGSGKSTLFNLITKIYSPPPGTVFLNGVDILKIPHQELRQEIGYTLQTAQLFSASVEQNILFGHSSDLTDDSLKKAAREAQILDDIERLAQGWKTEIGERGVRLSGGQKQRLALARLFLRNPQMFLLDDVLSAVDNITEKNLIHNLYKKNKAAIIASHRVSVLEQCDEVIVIENGTIKDRGTWQDLKIKWMPTAGDKN